MGTDALDLTSDAATAILLEIEQQVADFIIAKGGTKGLIEEGTTFVQWCNQLAEAGLKVDGKPFSLGNRAALTPIYEAIPTTREEAAGQMLVIMKAAQIGLTVWEVLAVLYMSIKWAPVNIGMFLPDQQTAVKKSEHRFMRIVRSSPLLHRLLTSGQAAGRPKEGNVLTRVIQESIVMFLWTTGKVTTESMPMDVTTLDEVQEMEIDHIDKVHARMGDSDVSFGLMLSTANLADQDIHKWYGYGTQEVWHTECPACGEFSDLSDPVSAFPKKSIAYNTGQIPGAPKREYVWTCPACSAWIQDPQRGRYVVTRPDLGMERAPTRVDEVDADDTEGPRMAPTMSKSVRSFLLPRTISPKLTPRGMIEGFNRADTPSRKKSFYNRVLARPYIDADLMPVTMAHCLAAAAEGMAMGLKWESRGTECYMGIDQMGGFNAVVIKRRLPDGRQATVHVEAIFNESPFDRCGDLMDLYGVIYCVVEQLPNVNDARRFTNRFPGRVFMNTGFLSDRSDMIVWGDDRSKNDSKTDELDRSRYSVAINQYKAMQTALFRVRNKHCLFPDPAGLEQDVIDKGEVKRIALLQDWVFVHFTKTALQVEEDPDERKVKARVLKIGLDPHYSFANMLCDVAWSRAYGTGSIFLPVIPASEPTSGSTLDQGKQPLPVKLDRLPPGQVCGKCINFDAERKHCKPRNFTVLPADPGCGIFVGKEVGGITEI